MESKSETFSSQGATVEVGTVTFEGRDFAALGFVADLANGVLVGYVARDKAGRYYLTTWGGEFLYVTLQAGRTWRAPKSHWASAQTTFAAVVDGFRYSGRCSGEGSCLRLKKGRKVA